MSSNNKQSLQIGVNVKDSNNKRFTIVNYSIELKDDTGNRVTLNSDEDLTKMLTENEIRFAYESITEILDFANNTVNLKKVDSLGGGYYGVSLTILIACAFDAMGRIGLDKNNKVSNDNNERFKFIQEKYVKNGNYGFSNDEFVDVFYKVYRCGLVHSGTIAKSYKISCDNSLTNVIIHDSNGETSINLDALIKMAKSIFKQLCNDYNISYPDFKFLGKTITGDTPTIITGYTQTT